MKHPRRTTSTDELILASPGAGVAAEKALARLRTAGDLLDTCEHLDAELRSGPGAFAVFCVLHPESLWCKPCGQRHLADAGEHPAVCLECQQRRDDVGLVTGIVPMRSGGVAWLDGVQLCAPCAEAAATAVERGRP